jgi:enoyl-CoA hydratase/carnithine racemase
MTVHAEVEGRVGWITLDRPPENRLDAASWRSWTWPSAGWPRPRWRWR